ncbi:MAG: VTT domain-containing protein [Dehalococcoidia bacterium]|nr:VTT domain-containing protein [Dehalococcoidia bacterium]
MARNHIDNAVKHVRVHWVRLTIAVVGLLGVSFGLAYLLQSLVARTHFPIYDYDWLTYLVVFGTSLLSNLTIIAPVPFAVSIMVAAATHWNPLIIAFIAAAGGAVGEMSGYYAGYFGRKIAITNHIMWYSSLEKWIGKYGAWGIFIIALQPVIPFDVGGLIAGIARMPIQKFFPALLGGRFIKYILVIYAGLGLINFLPLWSP